VVHFGLGDATRIDRLEIEWPSGETQELTDLEGDRHVVIQEGASNVDTVQRGQTIAP
jgi:hypothetical protein